MGRDGRPDDDSALLAVSMSAPAPAAPSVEDRHGDVHLHLVAALAQRWGSDRLAAGKRVWFELGVPAGG